MSDERRDEPRPAEPSEPERSSATWLALLQAGHDAERARDELRASTLYEMLRVLVWWL